MQLEHMEPSKAQQISISTFLMYLDELNLKHFYTDKMIGLKEAIFKL